MNQKLGLLLYARCPIVARALGQAAECAREQRYLAYKGYFGMFVILLKIRNKNERNIISGFKSQSVKGSFTNYVIGLGGFSTYDGGGVLPKITSFFTAIFELIFASFTIIFG